MDEKLKKIKREVELKFVRSQGPGGQNVNRTNSAVQLRWSIPLSQDLSEDEKILLMFKLAKLLNSEVELILKTMESRDQKQNIELSFIKLGDLLKKAFFKKKKRIKTKPTYASQERRLQSKRAHQDKKTGRRKNNWGE